MLEADPYEILRHQILRHKLVFRGTGEAVVGDAESNAAKIRQAVAKIVAGLPVETPH